MPDEASAESDDGEKRLSRFKKAKKLSKKYSSAVKANTVMQSSGYDHLEGHDFDTTHNAISEEYQKAGRVCVKYTVHGIVQGVGYRYFVSLIAKRFGIVGYVRNVKDGSVEVLALGERELVERFEKELRASEGYRMQVMHVDKVELDPQDEPDYADFRIEKDL